MFEQRGGRSGAPTRWRLQPGTEGVVVQLRDGAQLRRAARRRRGGRLVAPRSRARWASAFRSRPNAATTRRCRAGAFDLKRQLTFGGHGFVVTPLACGVRVGGAVELAGLDAPPNFARARRRCWPRPSASCRGCAPKAAAHGWAFGRRCPTRCRRSARPPRTRACVYAFGHGHLGLTQAAATARLVADIRGGPPAAARPVDRSVRSDSDRAASGPLQESP